jgi:hypothetical protein
MMHDAELKPQLSHLLGLLCLPRLAFDDRPLVSSSLPNGCIVRKTPF